MRSNHYLKLHFNSRQWPRVVQMDRVGWWPAKIEEERVGENHPELWLSFAEALGVARAPL
jgi:pyrroloquinoline quinone (PQQ) biosynthesis protein C